MARINIRNDNININTDQPVVGQEFTVTVPLNNREILGGGPNGCEVNSTTKGHLADVELIVDHEDGFEVVSLEETDVCVPTDQPFSSSKDLPFGVTVNEPGDITVTAIVRPKGIDGPDQASVSTTVVDTGESEGPTTPGSDDPSNGINIPDPPNGNGGGLLAFAVDNPGVTLALAGGAAIAINSFSSSLAE